MCFHRRHGVDQLRRGTRGAHRIGCGELRRLLVDGRAPSACRLVSRLSGPSATAAFEAGEEWAADGAKTAASWLSACCRVSRAAAKRRVRLGLTWGHLPEVTQAWRDGAIGIDAASAIASARRHRTEASMDRDEAMLVAQACELGLRRLLPGAGRWQTDGRPRRGRCLRRGAQGVAERLLRDESVGHVAGPDHLLDPISGSIVAAEALNRLRTRSLRGRLRPSQRTPGPHGEDRRVGPHLGPAPGRRPGRNGDEEPHRPRRWHPPRSVVFGLRRLRDDAGAASVSSRTAPCSHRRPSTRGWTRPTSSEPCSPWATGSTWSVRSRRAAGREGPSSCGTGSVRTPIAMNSPRTARPTTSRPTPQAGETTQENGRLLCGFHNRLRNQREHPGDERQRPPPSAA